MCCESWSVLEERSVLGLGGPASDVALPSSRECIECRLFSSGRLTDNQTCQRLCKDDIITVETLSE